MTVTLPGAVVLATIVAPCLLVAMAEWREIQKTRARERAHQAHLREISEIYDLKRRQVARNRDLRQADLDGDA